MIHLEFEFDFISFLRSLLLPRLRRILQIALLIKHIVGGAKDDKLGSAVQLIAYLLMLLGLLQDKFLGEHIALLEPRILLGQLLADGLRTLLAITHWGEALLLYAVLYQIVYHTLGSALRQVLVVFVVALIVAVGAQLYRYVRVLLQEGYQFVQCLG